MAAKQFDPNLARKHKGKLDILDADTSSDPMDEAERLAREEMSGLYLDIYKPVIRASGTSVNALNQAIYNSIDNTRAYKEDRSGHLYSLIRLTGKGFLRALDDEGFTRDPELSDILGCKVGQSNFYQDLIKLGEHHFKGTAIREEPNMGFDLTVNYHVYSNVTSVASNVAATSGFHTSLRVRTWISAGTLTKRQPVCWSEGAVPDRTHMQLDFNNSRINGMHTDKSLAKALNLSERAIAQWHASEKDAVLTHMKHASGACRTTRYVKMWGTYLAMVQGGIESIDLTAEVASAVCYDYSAERLPIIIAVTKNNGTSMYSHTNVGAEAAFLLLGCMEFPCRGLAKRKKVPFFGGFMIPSELGPGGKVVMISQKGLAGLANTTTAEDGYRAILTYASQTNTLAECRDGYSLAAALYLCDGMPNFSLPRAQGHMDMFCPSMRVMVNEWLVPPKEINQYLLLGALTVTRQAISMTKDFIAHKTANGKNQSAVIAVLSGDIAKRHPLYGWFGKNSFGPGFNIMAIIDPLQVNRQWHLKVLENIWYPSVAWSKVRDGPVLSGSFEHHMRSGQWHLPAKLTFLAEETAGSTVSTYTLLKVFRDNSQDEMHPRDLTNEDAWDDNALSKFAAGLVEGPVKVLPIEVVSKDPRPLKINRSKWKKRELPPEVVKKPPYKVKPPEIHTPQPGSPKVTTPGSERLNPLRSVERAVQKYSVPQSVMIDKRHVPVSDHVDLQMVDECSRLVKEHANDALDMEIISDWIMGIIDLDEKDEIVHCLLWDSIDMSEPLRKGAIDKWRMLAPAMLSNQTIHSTLMDHGTLPNYMNRSSPEFKVLQAIGRVVNELNYGVIPGKVDEAKDTARGLLEVGELSRITILHQATPNSDPMALVEEYDFRETGREKDANPGKALAYNIALRFPVLEKTIRALKMHH